jgi:hypothetical protein
MAALRRSFPDEAHLIPLPSERSNRTAAPSRTDGLTWSIIKTPALTSEIRFRFGLSIEGDEKKNSKDILAAPSCTSIRMRTCKFGCFRFCGHTRRRGTKVGGQYVPDRKAQTRAVQTNQYYDARRGKRFLKDSVNADRHDSHLCPF